MDVNAVMKQKFVYRMVFKNIYWFFLPARRYASPGYDDRNMSVCPSVCLSIRLSVTRRYCVKTK